MKEHKLQAEYIQQNQNQKSIASEKTCARGGKNEIKLNKIK